MEAGIGDHGVVDSETFFGITEQDGDFGQVFLNQPFYLF